ncbi:MAG TPA: tannase/feruloyl esterase family alpha/beta hydrolase [Candidatus Acidoferrales bacterium]|nr:tannase/feruloyl esterase family alpha/beta hydrolase [Candidatus Acidoferrales bacterium]
MPTEPRIETRHWWSLREFPLLLAGFLLASVPASGQQSCENLASLKIPDATITLAKSIATPPAFDVPSVPGRLGTPPGLKVSVPFCRVAGFATPTRDSHISFEVWLPIAANWNGSYVGVGNPGFTGAIVYGNMAREVARGSVTASSDTGHSDADASGQVVPTWAIGHPEKVADWGYRSVHVTAVIAKELIRAYYGKPEKFSFWSSCYEGGNQGLTEAQKYPNDFDGIAAGDPAYHMTRLQAGSEYLAWSALKDGVNGPSYIPPNKYAVLNRAALDACDALDGARDGFIEDPTRCHFDPATIRCPRKEDYASCLTQAQVETARRIYSGAKFADGKQIYPGFEPGSELNWGAALAGPNPPGINNGFFQSMVFEDPNWDFRTFDVDRDSRLADTKVGALVNMTDPNLRAFKAHGGKLLLYQSWEETAIPPRSVIDYYTRVLDAMGGPSQTQDFIRLFMVPGTGICPGSGMFSNGVFDALDVVEKWRETNVPPDRIITTHRTGNEVERTHPACPYPQAAIYKGTGDFYDASNFTCGNPTW